MYAHTIEVVLKMLIQRPRYDKVFRFMQGIFQLTLYVFIESVCPPPQIEYFNAVHTKDTPTRSHTHTHIHLGILGYSSIHLDVIIVFPHFGRQRCCNLHTFTRVSECNTYTSSSCKFMLPLITSLKHASIRFCHVLICMLT